MRSSQNITKLPTSLIKMHMLDINDPNKRPRGTLFYVIRYPTNNDESSPHKINRKTDKVKAKKL